MKKENLSQSHREYIEYKKSIWEDYVNINVYWWYRVLKNKSKEEMLQHKRRKR